MATLIIQFLKLHIYFSLIPTKMTVIDVVEHKTQLTERQIVRHGRL